MLSCDHLRGGTRLRCLIGKPVEPDPDHTGGGNRWRDTFVPYPCTHLRSTLRRDRIAEQHLLFRHADPL